jgi:hypothetical protein
MSSTVFGSLYKLNSSLFHLRRQHPTCCIRPYTSILRSIYLSDVFSICCVACVRVRVTLL